MNKHHAERAYLLYLARSGIPKRRSPGPITQSNYAAVHTQPTNCPTPFNGPCLIWRHSLDTHGYGILHLNGKLYRAHRVAYEMSRGEIPKDKLILHLCHRRSCIQPAHLYAGTQQQNALDRKARLSAEGRFTVYRFMEEYSARMHDGMKHYWDEPPELERTLFQQQTGAQPLCLQPFRPENTWRRTAKSHKQNSVRSALKGNQTGSEIWAVRTHAKRRPRPGPYADGHLSRSSKVGGRETAR